jgi:uncharacterized membrane protein YccC
MLVRNLLAVLAVLPLLGTNATWLGAWQKLLAVIIGLLSGASLQAALRLSTDVGPPHAELKMAPRNLTQRFSDPFFWRKLVVSCLALAIGLGLGAENPKYLYFGVVLLLNDSLGATLGRVRDRMVGVSLGVLMPWLVFNTIGLNSVAVALVMGGTTALVLRRHLCRLRRAGRLVHPHPLDRLSDGQCPGPVGLPAGSPRLRPATLSPTR